MLRASDATGIGIDNGNNGNDMVSIKEINLELQKLNVNIDYIKAAGLRRERLRDILDILKKRQK